MANKFNYRSGPFHIVPVPMGSGVACEIGDLMKISTGKMLKMVTSTDNLAWIGVAAQRHSTTDGSMNVGLYLPIPGTIFEFDLNTSTAVVFGDQLQYNAAKTLKVSTTDAIAVAMESKLAATVTLVTFKLPQHTNGLKLVGDAS